MSAREEMINDAREMVALYIKAEKTVLMGQSYTIAGQSLTRADLDKIRAGRKEWEDKLSDYLGISARRIRRVWPLDD